MDHFVALQRYRMSANVHPTVDEFPLPLSHGGNTGSNPVGDANRISMLLLMFRRLCPACVPRGAKSVRLGQQTDNLESVCTAELEFRRSD